MLETEVLLEAYRRGIFPMAVDKRGTIGWFSPDPRAIIPLDARFHVPHGLRRVWKRCSVISDSSGRAGCLSPPPNSQNGAVGAARPTKAGFDITFDQDFPVVIRECAKRREGTWISPGIRESYCRLHQLGHAHSVETWLNGKLVGGLYGVHIGAAFFGESMFHRATDASKVALVALVERLRQRGFVLLDTQWQTPHLRQFGTVEISRQEYLRILAKAISFDCKFAANDSGVSSDSA
jgi:leucyl/phenylalanyl-tRNA--protein transferase